MKRDLPVFVFAGIFALAMLRAAGDCAAQASASPRASGPDPLRYETHVASAKALRDQKQFPKAAQRLQIALSLAPDDVKPDILRALTEVRVAGLSPDARRKLDAVMLVAEQAAHVKTSADARPLLIEYLVLSNTFLQEQVSLPDLWLLRARAALVLDYPEIGWVAGRQLIELGVSRADEPAMRSTMAQLERRGWLDGLWPRRKLDDTLARTLIPRGGTRMCMSIYAHAWDCDVVTRLAEAGDGVWQLELGIVRETESDQSPNRNELLKEALKWFRGAAAQGFATAYLELGSMYADGQGVPKDAGEAIRWYRKAASLGEPRAQRKMGTLLWSGVEGQLASDPAEAIRLLRQAAARRDPEAERYLGFAYRRGGGVEGDPAQALRWYRASAAHAVHPDYLMLLSYHESDIENWDYESKVRSLAIAQPANPDLYMKIGDLQRALVKARARQAAKLQNDLAWMFATDADGQFRDGSRAVQLARAACEGTDWLDGDSVDTLAAAQAEAGAWDQALDTEAKAIQLMRSAKNPDAKQIAEAEARLELYRRKQPYRQPE